MKDPKGAKKAFRIPAMALILPRRKLLHLLQASLLLVTVFAAAKLLGVGKWIAGEAERNVEQRRDTVEQGFIGDGRNSLDVMEQQEPRDVAKTNKEGSEWVREGGEVISELLEE